MSVIGINRCYSLRDQQYSSQSSHSSSPSCSSNWTWRYVSVWVGFPLSVCCSLMKILLWHNQVLPCLSFFFLLLVLFSPIWWWRSNGRGAPSWTCSSSWCWSCWFYSWLVEFTTTWRTGSYQILIFHADSLATACWRRWRWIDGSSFS